MSYFVVNTQPADASGAALDALKDLARESRNRTQWFDAMAARHGASDGEYGPQ